MKKIVFLRCFRDSCQVSALGRFQTPCSAINEDFTKKNTKQQETRLDILYHSKCSQNILANQINWPGGGGHCKKCRSQFIISNEVATVRSAEVSWQSWMFLAALAASLACKTFGQTVLTNDKTYWCRSQNNLFALLLIVFGQIAILWSISATFLGWGPKKRSVDH